jgi:hypothetical protein
MNEDMIHFRCPGCGRALKARADKVGRKARCACGATVVVPEAGETPVLPVEEDAEGPATPSASPAAEMPPPIPLVEEPPAAGRSPGKAVSPQARPGTPVRPPAVKTPSPPTPPGTAVPPPSPAADTDDADDEGAYRLVESFDKPIAPPPPAYRGDEEEEEEKSIELEEEEEEEGKEDEEEAALRERRKRLISQLKKIEHPEAWERVRQGLLLLTLGVAAWALGLSAQRLFVALGAFMPLEYGSVASLYLTEAVETPAAGEPRALDRVDFFLGLLGGSRLFLLGKVLTILGVSLLLIGLLLAGVGWGLCLAAPPQQGARGLAWAGLGLVLANFFMVLFFQLLPLTGLYRYTLVAYLFPEVAITEGNTGRAEPIHLSWSLAPLGEMFLALFLQLLLLAPLVLSAVFLRAVGLALKVESMQNNGVSLIRLSLGTAFAWLVYLCLINAGTSNVLIIGLRAVYWFASAALVVLLCWLGQALFYGRESVGKVLKVGWAA